MSLHELPELPDEARLWVFAANPELEEAEASRLAERLRRFLPAWTAHRRELRAGFTLRERRFLLVVVDESRAPASGCSIDALVRELGQAEEELGVRLLDSAPVWYRDEEGRVQAVSRAEFRRLAAEGRVTARTPVFDLTLSDLGAVRGGGLEVAAEDSWHGRLLAGAATGSAGRAGG